MGHRLRSVAVLSALALAVSCPALADGNAPPEPIEQLQWRWDDSVPHRWHVHVDVQLPLIMWFAADYNQQARASAFTLDLVFSCGDTGHSRKGLLVLECAIEDAALTGTTYPTERGKLQPILREMDDKLTGAIIQLELRDNGRVQAVDLERASLRKGTNRRSRRMHENLRLIVKRAMAGLDLELPKGGTVQDNIWGQYRSALFEVPSTMGTTSTAEIAHYALRRAEGDVLVRSSGQATLMPGTSNENIQNFYRTRMESVAIFDDHGGTLRERTWTVIGVPTGSSAVAGAFAGIPYVQQGKLRALSPVDRPDLGDTVETRREGPQPSALQQSTFLGSSPADTMP